jgi:hypothetical protein
MKKTSIAFFLLVSMLMTFYFGSVTGVAAGTAGYNEFVVIHGTGNETVTAAVLDGDSVIVLGKSDSPEFGLSAGQSFIAKYTLSGQLTWIRAIPGSVCDLAKTNAGYVVAGEADKDRFVIQYDASGNVIWENSQMPDGYQGVWQCVKLDNSGNIVLGGYVLQVGNNVSESFSNFDMAAVTVLNPTGTPLWNQTFRVSNSDRVDEIAISGNTYSCIVRSETFGMQNIAHNLKTVIVPLGQNGSVSPAVDLPGGVDDISVDNVSVLSNGQGYILAGKAYSNNQAEGRLVLLDNQSQAVMTSSYPGTAGNGHVMLTDCMNTGSGSYTALFTKNTAGPGADPLGQMDGVLCSLNAGGGIIDATTLGGTGEDRFIKLLDSSNGLIAVGYSNSPEFTGTNDQKSDIVFWLENAATPPAPARPQYSDIGALSAENIEAINYLSEKEVLNGKGDGVFAPGDSVSRAEFAKILVLAFSLKDDGTSAAAYADVPEGKWYHQYIKIASQAGMIGGYSDGTFKPDQVILKQEIVKLCGRFLQDNTDLKGNEALLSSYQDAAQILGWVKPYAAILAEAGVLKPADEANFNGSASMTRADAALLVYRTLQAMT